MKRSFNVFLGGILVCLWMLQPGQTPAAPAQAAGNLVIYVDDGPGNNGSTSCPATNIHSLDDAMGSIGMQVANITWYICPGTYFAPGGGVGLSGYRNFKIIGKGGPVITPPVGLSASLFNFVNSTDVTIEGLTINGGSQQGTNFTAAIRFENTSGTIKGNTITAWHRAHSGPPPFDIGASNAPLHSIVVDGVGFSDRKVEILNNSIYDPQDTGILVGHLPAAVKISKNRVVFGSGIIPALAPASNIRMQAGIALVNSGPGSTISGNEVTSDSDLYPRAAPYARGILVYGTPGAKITANVVRGTAMQIGVENWCNLVGINASNNIVSGNKLYDSWFIGIRITARNDTVTAFFDCQTTPHTDSVSITGNSIYNTAFGGSTTHFGVYLETYGGLISAVTVKGNTFGGFSSVGSNPETVHYNDLNGIPNAVLGPNKVLAVPPAGVQK